MTDDKRQKAWPRGLTLESLDEQARAMSTAVRRERERSPNNIKRPRYTRRAVTQGVYVKTDDKGLAELRRDLEMGLARSTDVLEVLDALEAEVERLKVVPQSVRDQLEEFEKWTAAIDSAEGWVPPFKFREAVARGVELWEWASECVRAVSDCLFEVIEERNRELDECEQERDEAVTALGLDDDTVAAFGFQKMKERDEARRLAEKFQKQCTKLLAGTDNRTWIGDLPWQSDEACSADEIITVMEASDD